MREDLTVSAEMIASQAARDYLNLPPSASISETRERFGGEIIIRGGKPFILFPDESVLSIEKIVKAKFACKQGPIVL